jgi:hypothetical protein
VAVPSITAKRKVIQLLFGPHSHELCNRDNHCPPLDHTKYSYSDLKAEYLDRIQQLHPDKIKGCPAVREAARLSFVQLQEAWNKYDEAAKLMKKVKNCGSETSANFTMFGVGCSFADNDRERSLRIEYMDQACRGWIPSAALASGLTSELSSVQSVKPNKGASCTFENRISLMNDDDFVVVDSVEKKVKPASSSESKSRSLLGHLPYFRKQRQKNS